MSIFRKKDVGLSQTEMKRHLTLRDVVLLGIDYWYRGINLGRSSPDYFGFDFSRLCGYVGDFLC